ncbi:2-oxoglutarate dehydrogenase E1 component [Methylocapsa palsarum]|uniref:2-oxoglutarate dehydrogenase E1 component n=1 Tax=Methylocapsa palsarum TaxID=1612308 RepID=A0A1I4A2A2_9HYPH|nr:2-oxoglutarate dehydrogenase E1 component [Methylocapsa palsarum]SFK50448.1 2-oxoglutarate dehydrogenase E1 component [Methylocapsa palsarum]
MARQDGSGNANGSGGASAGRSPPNAAFAKLSFLYGGNAAYVEQLYADYERDPASVDPEWRDYFATLNDDRGAIERSARGPAWKAQNWPVPANGELVSALDGHWPPDAKEIGEKIKSRAAKAEASAPASSADLRRATRDSVRALMMIRAYRMRGHLHARLDPLELEPPRDHEELHPATYGFTEADYDRKIFIDNVLGLESASVREMLPILRRTYCDTIGFEFMHMSDPAEKGWMQARIEGPGKEISFTREGKRAILYKLIEAEGFEKFLDIKYTGTKRFGLDGGEAIVPALEQIIKRGGALGVCDIVLGMAHRGRLNVLSQVMGKPHRAIFHEFKGGSYTPDEVEGSGDVKYHLGASSDRDFDNNKVHLSLTANPSHLEIVDPVVLGKVRAKQDQLGDVVERTRVLPLLIHGDAAFAGQGVIAECFGLSGLKGYRTGGSIHFIINNQIGFTTSPRFSRSSPYPSDTAKMIEAPIIHVNGDDPEAVVYAAKIAIEFRQKFHKPVVIDMFCYRRFGHNEGDEPSFTQPLMYKKIRSHKTTLEIYAEKLIAQGILTAGEVDKLRANWHHHLENAFEAGQAYHPNKADWLDGRWAGLKPALASGEDDRRGRTGVERSRLTEIGLRLTTVPEGFNLHRTIARLIDNRRKMIETGEGIDWSMAETLAFASLVDEGHPVRLSGQDSERGTFSQRHSVLTDQETEARYIPLNNIRDEQAHYEVINSMLSEEAVLGFEYGYSLSEPNALTVWEAQFGDFANGAQVLFDQFISSGERKWLRMSGLVCLLPHGYEGQGPEHSSARLERYLQLCAEDNMQVANCTTPANYFHVLRRQLKRDIRKPLILMTPKSLLRHKRAVSKLDDFVIGSSFHRLLRDDAERGLGTEIKLVEDSRMRVVVLCSGKVYYDIFEEREKRGADDVYILRVEQLYPMPLKNLVVLLSRFKNANVVWCQEESKNMGAWTFVEPYLEWALGQAGGKSKRPRYAGRPASASPATGLMSKHLAQLKTFLDEVFAA